MRCGCVALVLALAAVGCASSSPTAKPPTAVSATTLTKLSGESSGTGRCGAYSVDWHSPEIGSTGAPPATLDVRRGTRVVLTARGHDEFEQIDALWCGDVTGDGRPEFAHEVFTGGAHCCFTLRVDTLEGPRLLDADLGNAGPLDPKQLDSKDALEIPSYSHVFVGDLPYVATPTVPRIFAFEGGRYTDAVTKFPDEIRKSLRSALRDLETRDPNEIGVQGQEGFALGAYAHYVLLGQQETGLREVTSRVPADVAQWLRDHAGEVEKALSSGT